MFPVTINSKNGFDLIVLSEVLYYLPTPDDAVTALRQCATWLDGGGLIVISLKDDGKSHAIVRQVAKQFAVLSSFLFQDQEKAHFRVLQNTGQPRAASLSDLSAGTKGPDCFARAYGRHMARQNVEDRGHELCEPFIRLCNII